MTKRKSVSRYGIRLQTDVRMPSLVKVSSYTRVRNGKTEKVRSYYRRTWDADVVRIQISTR